MTDEEARRAAANVIAQAMADEKYGHLERRVCTFDAPMPMDQRHAYRWTHPDALQVGRFFNLATFTCPHCHFNFNAIP